MTKRKTYRPLLAVLGVLLAGLAVYVSPIRAQDLGPNLLENPGFEGGHFFQDNLPEIVVPNGWRMHWSNDELIFGGEWKTTRPETIVWNSSGGVPAGEEIFWKDGVYTMKVFNSWAPLWAALSQDVKNLEVGRTYRLVAPIYVDVFEEFKDGKKIAPWRKDTGRVRLGAGPTGATWRDEKAIKYSGWWTAETIDPFYQAYPTFVHDFVATQPNMTVWIEMASTYPYANNGFFFDLPGLYATTTTTAVAAAATAPAGQVAAVAAAPVVAQAATFIAPTPRADGSVVHIVQPGESLWVIAIRYAELLGMPPEDALPHIQELNNNPTFVNPDDEIVIIAANTAAATTEATPGEGTLAAEGTPAEGATVETTPAAGDTTPAAEAETTPAADATAEFETVETLAGTICVGAFHDANADGQRNEGETLVADAAIAIARAGTTVSTYITDGASEPFCFELTQPDSYQLQLYPPAGFAATTEDNWAVSIADGESYTVSFGLSDAPEVVADTTAADADAAATDETAAETDETAAESGGLPGNLGLIIVGVAAVLVVLAVVGVVLLRRG